MHEVIFGTETFWGKLFDIILLAAILLSIASIMLESVKEIAERYSLVLDIIEWMFTILFTFEYAARVLALNHPKKYIFSFYGIIDFLSILPTYLGLVFVSSQSFMIIRVFRLLRIFRIFKLAHFLGEANQLGNALKASRHKITVFMVAVVIIVVIAGTTMYLIEDGVNGFTSIPRSMYWAIVTITTVGYGDIAPKTVGGQFLASLLMILGYAVIAVPTGIVSAELTRANESAELRNDACPSCGNDGHEPNASFCKHCGSELD